MKFRKKPVVIEAIQWCPNQKGKNNISYPSSWGKEPKTWEVSCITLALLIPTLEGVMICDKGDWIIKGIKGEFYPCKPDIFEATYEKVED